LIPRRHDARDEFRELTESNVGVFLTERVEEGAAGV
jgi:hypothetical protein